MRILVAGPTGRTGRHIIAALRAKDPELSIRGMCRYPQTYARSIEVIPGNTDGGGEARRAIEVIPGNTDGGGATRRAIEVIPGNTDGGGETARAIEVIPGNTDIAADRACAVADVDVVIYYAPAFDPHEAAMGMGMIDAAVAAGVRRFIYVSVLNPQVPSLPDHVAKRAIEGYLAQAGLQWTVLRPQRYMQNIAVAAATAAGRLDLPFPPHRPMGHVDLADLAQVVVRVALEDGHAHAVYDIASRETLTVAEMAQIMANVSGRAVASGELPLAALGAGYDAAARDAVRQLYAYHAQHGSNGNANVLRMLLGREPGTFENYVERALMPA